MLSCRLALLSIFIHTTYSDWVSEWLNPLQQQYKSEQNDYFKAWNEGKDIQILPRAKSLRSNMQVEELSYTTKPTNFPLLLETTIEKAKSLLDSLKKEISKVLEREMLLKDAIANGRLGVTVATVTMIGRPSRSYLIKNDTWTVCKGNVLYPHHNTVSSNWQDDWPKCFGREITTNRDPCVFNSIIKYKTIPTTKRSIYNEDDYLCQKTSFSYGFEKYMSVSRNTIQQTCKNDISRSFTENQLECGQRIITEYTLYPYRWYLNSLPEGYCDGNGTCKLTVAWHISNVTIENFEYFEIDDKFKQYFIIPQNTDLLNF